MSGVLNVWDGSQWQVVQTGVGALDTLPIGAVVQYAGGSTPSGYLVADGSAVSRTAYASLFAVIGTTFGVGDGSTTFNLPNETITIPPPAGRLTLTSGTPITTGDVTGAGTIYYTPYNGNSIMLYTGGAWWTFPFAETSLSLTVTSGKNYDVFAYNSSGTATLELSAAWNSDTARFSSGTYASNLPTQNGVYVKSTDGNAIDATRRYLGTIRATGTNTIEDSKLHRFLSNYYNRVWKPAEYTDGSLRQTTSNAFTQVGAVQIDYVHGVSEYFTHIQGQTSAYGIGTVGEVVIGSGTTTAATNAIAQAGGIESANVGFVSGLTTLDEAAAVGYTIRYLIYKANTNGQTFFADGTGFGATTPPNFTALRAMIWC